jgi:hypothetical protein
MSIVRLGAFDTLLRVASSHLCSNSTADCRDHQPKLERASTVAFLAAVPHLRWIHGHAGENDATACSYNQSDVGLRLYS